MAKKPIELSESERSTLCGQLLTESSELLRAELDEGTNTERLLKTVEAARIKLLRSLEWQNAGREVVVPPPWEPRAGDQVLVPARITRINAGCVDVQVQRDLVPADLRRITNVQE